MKRRVLKKSEVLREGYVKGLRKAYQILAEMYDDYTDAPPQNPNLDLKNAIITKHLDEAKVALERGANPDKKVGYGGYGRSLLFSAIEAGAEFFSLLLQYGANIHEASDDSHPDITLLHYAASYDTDICRTLIKLGFDVNATTEYHKTPMNFAAQDGNVKTLELLLNAGADIQNADKFGFTPLHDAVSHGKIENTKFLIDNGADINASSNTGLTPLHVACESRYQAVTKITKMLIDAGADLEATDKKGKTPLMVAQEWGRKRLIKLLEKA